jgi:hypothetical protein
LVRRIRLIEEGEDCLLRAAESGAIPVSVAIQIAESKYRDIQVYRRARLDINPLLSRRASVDFPPVAP